MLEFKRGIIISAKYEYCDDNDISSITQEITIIDNIGKEYVTYHDCHGTCFNNFFGEGDKISFLYDKEIGLVLRLRLNPFYKE